MGGTEQHGPSGRGHRPDVRAEESPTSSGRAHRAVRVHPVRRLATARRFLARSLSRDRARGGDRRDRQPAQQGSAGSCCQRPPRQQPILMARAPGPRGDPDSRCSRCSVGTAGGAQPAPEISRTQGHHATPASCRSCAASIPGVIDLPRWNVRAGSDRSPGRRDFRSAIRRRVGSDPGSPAVRRAINLRAASRGLVEVHRRLSRTPEDAGAFSGKDVPGQALCSQRKPSRRAAPLACWRGPDADLDVPPRSSSPGRRQLAAFLQPRVARPRPDRRRRRSVAVAQRGAAARARLQDSRTARSLRSPCRRRCQLVAAPSRGTAPPTCRRPSGRARSRAPSPGRRRSAAYWMPSSRRLACQPHAFRKLIRATWSLATPRALEYSRQAAQPERCQPAAFS